jgi:hypothetical protein
MSRRSAFLTAGLLLSLVLAALIGTGPTSAGTAPAEAASTLQPVEQVFAGDLTAPAAADASCIDRLAAGRAGVATRQVTVPAEGVLTATLKASDGDWDLAVFDEKTGVPLAQSANRGADELASGFVGTSEGGRRVVVQACRRGGSARTAGVVLALNRIEYAGQPEKASLVEVATPRREDKDRLTDLGLDLTEHGDEDSVEVVLHGAADAQRLREAGFTWTVEQADLMARARELASIDRAYAQRTARSPLPSGRDGYRRLAEINDEMKKLAEANPGHVKMFTAKHRSIEGREIYGLEVTKDVAADDAKPVFLQLGVHHAREWPSVEMPMEFANDLIKGFAAGDARTRDLLSKVRVIFVPVVNVDGYNLSREAPVDLRGPAFALDGQFEDSCDLGNAVTGVCAGYSAALLADPNFAYKRKNCRIADGQTQPAGVCGLQTFRQLGTDPNRNYGALWGGAGASPLPNNDTYRGAGPFSEPETQNVQDLVSRNQVTTLITNHTFSNLVLRSPGVKSQGLTPDEAATAALGAAMTSQNGYTNQASWELYDTTGTTEDWSYSATGGYGYTFEIGPNEFHPPYQEVVDEYLGKAGTPTEGKGNRGAYFAALENAADQRQHSVITGTAPKDAVLRLGKEFMTATSPVVSAVPGQAAGPPREFKDVLNTTTTTEGGPFAYHANPSTRPGKLSRRVVASVAETPFSERQIGSTRQTKPGFQDTDPVDLIAPDYGPENYEDIPITIRAEDQVALLDIVVRSGEDDDYDAVLYRKGGRDPVPDVDDDDDAGNSAGQDEIIRFAEPPAGEYFLRVNNYSAQGPFTGTIKQFKAGAVEVRSGSTEAWTMTCETKTGTVIAARKVEVARGERVDVGAICGENAAEIIANERRRSNGVVPLAKSGEASCATTAGFRSTSVRPRGAGLVLAFARRLAEPVRIEVFQTSVGRRVIRERRVAVFNNLSTDYRWDGRAKRRLTDGTYFVRYSVRGLGGQADVRRETLVRRGGRFQRRPSHYARASCGLLKSFKLERPAFGGRSNTPLRIAFQVAQRSNVTVTVVRGRKTVKRFVLRGRRANRTYRMSVPARRLARGDYRVTATATAGRRRATGRLVSRKL